MEVSSQIIEKFCSGPAFEPVKRKIKAAAGTIKRREKYCKLLIYKEILWDSKSAGAYSNILSQN